MNNELISRLKGTPDLTPEQVELLTPIIHKLVLESMDSGIELAVEMIRLSPNGLTKEELARLIERTISTNHGN